MARGKTVKVVLPPAAHRALSNLATINGQTLSEAVRQAIWTTAKLHVGQGNSPEQNEGFAAWNYITGMPDAVHRAMIEKCIQEMPDNLTDVPTTPEGIYAAVAAIIPRPTPEEARQAWNNAKGNGTVWAELPEELKTRYAEIEAARLQKEATHGR